jgi:hypothetical protein
MGIFLGTIADSIDSIEDRDMEQIEAILAKAKMREKQDVPVKSKRTPRRE